MGICFSSCRKSSEKESSRPGTPIKSGEVKLEKKNKVSRDRSVSFKGESKEEIKSRLEIKRNVSILSKTSKLTIPEENRSRAPTIVINEALDNGDELARDL